MTQRRNGNMRSITRQFLLSILAFVSAGVAQTASGQAVVAGPQCATHDQIVEILAEKFHEHLRVIAISKRGALLEIYASAEGSWTLVRTRTTGEACLLAIGDDIELVPDLGEAS